MSDAWVALLAAVFGGAGLKVIESVLTRGRDKSDIATQIRQELRDDVTSLRDELRAVEADLDAWKEKYYLDLGNWKDKYFNLMNVFQQLKLFLVEHGFAQEVAKFQTDLDTGNLVMSEIQDEVDKVNGE